MWHCGQPFLISTASWDNVVLSPGLWVVYRLLDTCAPLVVARALYQPLFPEPMDFEPDPHPHPPNPSQPRDPITEEEFRALFLGWIFSRRLITKRTGIYWSRLCSCWMLPPREGDMSWLEYGYGFGDTCGQTPGSCRRTYRSSGIANTG